MRMFPRFRPPANAAGREGCGFWIISSIASLLMLCVNLAIVQFIYQLLTPLSPDMLQNPRVAQATLLIAPALLVFIEWWLWEWLLELLIRDRPTRKIRGKKRS